MAITRILLRLLVILIVLIVVLGGLGWYTIFREVPQTLADNSIEEYFKYGSIGTENAAGLPFWLWLILPRMFPEYLPGPGGWAALGFVWEPGRELPVGFSKKIIGVERVGINCALCHTTQVRRPGEAVPRLYLGGPGNTVDILSYQRFLFACASDPRFTSGTILKEIAQVTQLSWLDRMLYRYVFIPATRKTLRQQKKQWAWTYTRPAWGRGRIDPFNPVKVAILKVGVGDTLGNADMEALWNMRPRLERHMALHWDGLNTDLTEVILSSAIGDQATPKSLPLKSLKQLETWMQDLKPPRFADLFAVHQELAASGAPIFQAQCARCHSFEGKDTGQVLPLNDDAWRQGLDTALPGPLYTDPHRANMWTDEAARAYNAYSRGYALDFQHFRATGGYVNVPLDALWLRAPYLHNGSVPSVADLLEPPARRPRLFYRGYDLYDPQQLGFVSDGPEARRAGTRYDTAEPGNSPQGHLWGTTLSTEEKRALLEFLKTL